MRRWMIAFALTAARLWAQGGDPEHGPDEEAPHQEDGESEGDLPPFVPPAGFERSAPEMPAGVVMRGERDSPALFVRLREPGTLQTRIGEDWKDTTLDELSNHLREFAEQQDREMKKGGKSAYVAAPGGVTVSRLFLSIDAGPTVPWQHVQWVLTMAVEQEYYKLELTDGARTLLASLPVRRGLRIVVQEPPREIKAEVHAIARAETRQKWGDAEVSRPTEIRFKMGGQIRRRESGETTELAPVADYLREAKKAVEDRDWVLVGGIKAGHKVPFSKVLDLMETFEAGGVARVDFYGTAIPTPEIRKASRLPYPAKNYSAD
ncbi:MAG TPA: hypothetical protein VFY93_14655 [Planctomycetota bacterium]|nr:hypothetical protein [Planctomycetota bacterium]